MDPVVESARHDWADGRRRFDDEARHPERAELLHTQLEAVARHLRRRLGDHYTLAELTDAYADAEHWARVAIDETALDPRPASSLAFVVDTAFQLASLNASDYVP